MKTVRDACQLQPNALSVKLSDQIEQLDELISAEGNGTAFFDRTFITQGMKDLITEGIARLAGASSQAVFHLKQAMGGGKTHLLVGFGLLARHPALRAGAQRLRGAVPRDDRPRQGSMGAVLARAVSAGHRGQVVGAVVSNETRCDRASQRTKDETCPLQ